MPNSTPAVPGTSKGVGCGGGGGGSDWGDEVRADNTKQLW